ncbi:hypothetical protein [Variovorax sp. RA8]|uniref:hypothetical protein n=1 Tax=Variovorax sp. (strain JCM 16519 / RA8) TaxID=662548 RepID=UPI000AEE807B|nr:hypothetical protein [Variovorax sp. RA8]VTU34634.1 hypothetical protein RA8CHR_05012 [Variovorax sp. RA8]
MNTPTLTKKEIEMDIYIKVKLFRSELTEISYVWFRLYIRHGLKVGECLFYDHFSNNHNRRSLYYITTATKNAFDLQQSLQSSLGEKPITTRKLKI